VGKGTAATNASEAIAMAVARFCVILMFLLLDWLLVGWLDGQWTSAPPAIRIPSGGGGHVCLPLFYVLF
jgi:hypothetical protein